MTQVPAQEGLLVGYARCSTEEQDLTAQRDALARLGVQADRVYVDHGLTGTNRARAGLREALAACRTGDTLVVTKLDRLGVIGPLQVPSWQQKRAPHSAFPQVRGPSSSARP